MLIPYGLRRFMHDDPKDNPSGGAGDGGAPSSASSEADDLLNSIKSLLGDKTADVSGINNALFRDNYRLREDRRALRTELVNAKKGGVPDGAEVIQGDDLKEFQAFKGLGLNVEQVSNILTAHDELSTRVMAADAATALGWKPKVLQDLIESKGLVIEDREVEQTGKDGKKEKVQLPHVIEQDGSKEKATLLAEYEPLKEYHPSLVTEAGTGGRTQNSGIRVPAQAQTGSRPTGDSTPSSVVQGQLSARYRRPSAGADKGKK